jgi:hypothetical protein
VSHGDGWTYIGHTDGPIKLATERATGTLEEFFGLPPSVTITVNVTDFEEKLAGLYRMIHEHHAWAYPKEHRRCLTCHPQMAPHPLAVNGREYHRRQMARARRRR